MTRPFRLSSSVQDGTAVVTVAGRIGPDAAAELSRTILAAIKGPAGPDVVVELASVDFIDENGLETLVVGERAAALLGGTLHMGSPSPAVIDAALEGLRVMRSLRTLL